MKKIISVLILALSLLNAKSFEESKKELVKFYNDQGALTGMIFIAKHLLRLIKKENILVLK